METSVIVAMKTDINFDIPKTKFRKLLKRIVAIDYEVIDFCGGYIVKADMIVKPPIYPLEKQCYHGWWQCIYCKLNGL